MEEGKIFEVPSTTPDTYLGIRKAEAYGKDLTVEQTIKLDTGLDVHTVIEIIGKSSAPTTFILECSVDETHWYEVRRWTYTTWAHGGFMNATRWVRLRSLAAGTAGDTVDLIISAMR